MRRIRLKRPSHATVVAYLALFVALGGTAWAVAANSVGTVQLKNGAVTTPKIADGAVRSYKVADHSLLAKDFAAGQIGPRQFDMHADEGKTLELPEVKGLTLKVTCSKAGTTNVSATFFAHDPGQSVGVSGFAEVNDEFKAITAQSVTRYYVIDAGRSGGVGANFDVLARNVQSPNKWTHWVVGIYNDGTGHGCGVWGNVDPPSN